MNRRAKFLVGAAIIVAAVGALIFTAVRETSSYYMTVDEYARDPAGMAGKPLRLAGRVSGGSVRWEPRTLDLEFHIQAIPPRGGGALAPGAAEAAGPPLGATAAGATLPVRYNGILPDMFGDGRDVIVEGRVQDGVFQARTLLTTCPSKYEADLQGAPPGEPAAPGSGATGRAS